MILAAILASRSKPKIFQKFIREASYGSIVKNEEKQRDAGCHAETQTEWSWTADMDLILHLKKHLAVSEWKILMAKGKSSLINSYTAILSANYLVKYW